MGDIIMFAVLVIAVVSTVGAIVFFTYDAIRTLIDGEA